jgi:hypothetical protein
MTSARNAPKAAEFGDFQTPSRLARQVCDLLAQRGLAPAAIIEPTCGVGNFLLAALDRFPMVERALAVEINPAHASRLRATLQRGPHADRVQLLQESFFDAPWPALLRDLPDPVVVIGNPPWVTNAQVGTLAGSNLPKKTNFQKHKGLDARTGKSNFDISEWMLIKLLELLHGRPGTVAMLCKTAVARKVLQHAWKHGMQIADAEIRPIDAATFFNATVEACLLVCTMVPSAGKPDGRIYPDLEAEQPASVIGYHDGVLIADVQAYNLWRHLAGAEVYRWRSGVKHDCAKVMELRPHGRGYRNGLGQLVQLESDYLYPMLKSSDLANGQTEDPDRWMLITQRAVGDGTSGIRVRAPRTWKYLEQHGERLDRRASSIYRNRPRFAVFGVGDYTFSPWKVGISGLYKRLHFTPIGSFAGKPIVLDDTAYFIACRTEQEADYLASLLNSEAAAAFYSAFIFWDAKRPITVDVLRRLDLVALAREVGTETMLRRFCGDRMNGGQGELFEEE